MKLNHLVPTACFLSALGALPACNNDTPTGALTVPFQIGSNNVCAYKDRNDADVPVEQVRVALYNPGTVGDPNAMVVAEDIVDCTEGQALFTTVAIGNYEIVAEGLEADGTVVFDNVGENSKAEVLDGQDITADTVRLNLTPAKLALRWSFKGFEFNQCTQVPLETIAVEARRDDGNSSLGEGEFTCDQAPDLEMGYHLLADDARDFNGNDIDTIEISPKDSTGKTIGELAVFSFTPPGPGREVNLTIDITCTMTSCDFACGNAECVPD